MNLRTEADLAAMFGIAEAKVAELRRKHRWPHVRLGRFDVRYTAEQVAAIVVMQTPKVKSATTPGVAGQTTRSARRAS